MYTGCTLLEQQELLQDLTLLNSNVLPVQLFEEVA